MLIALGNCLGSINAFESTCMLHHNISRDLGAECLLISFINQWREEWGYFSCAWNTKFIEVSDWKISEFFVLVLCRNKEDDDICAFSGVYAPCDQGSSVRLWEGLSRVMAD